jgi:hypothetical protein
MLSTGIGIILILGALLCGFLCIVLAFIEFKKQVSG